jgi:transposase InsO family protein
MIGLNSSTYYYKPKKSRIDKEAEDSELCDKIEYLQLNYSCWGHRTLKRQLFIQYGIIVNLKKILRIMRKYDLFREKKRLFVKTTDSNHGFPIYPNLIKGIEVDGINQVWIADITYIRILTGFVYLAAILDIYSRKVIGWAISKEINHKLCIAALEIALNNRKVSEGLIHHSDRGVQYACKEYIQLLEENKIKISMSNKGNPYDNAFMESFFKTLKNEEVYLWEYEDFIEVTERVPYFIEEVYNKKRVHSGIKYLSPEKFESIILDENLKKEFGEFILKL